MTNVADPRPRRDDVLELILRVCRVVNRVVVEQEERRPGAEARRKEGALDKEIPKMVARPLFESGDVPPTVYPSRRLPKG